MDRKRSLRGWSDVPAPVQRMFKHGFPVIPRLVGKGPPFKWRKYKDRPPTQRDIIRWTRKYPSVLWAVITGHQVIVAEFDGEEGQATMERLHLRPHFLSPSGGGHVYVEAPSFLVQGGPRVDPERFPGMDLLAYGQTATFYGQRPDGRYRPNPGAPDGLYTLETLPAELRALIKARQFKRRELRPLPLPEDFGEQIAAQVLLGEALARLNLHPRNLTGLWLACQLRDERYAFVAAEQWMYQYADLVVSHGDHPYTRQEAYDTLVSAFSRPARLPRMLRDGAVVELLSEVQAEKVEWLWPGRIPMRKVTIIEGDPERGKSTVTLDIAARVTRGRPMPDGARSGGAGAVLTICAEDDIADTVKARLSAAGALQDRVAYMPLRKDDQGRVVPLSIPEDLARIEAAIRKVKERTGRTVKLVIIDPITAYLSEKIHYGNDPQVRKALLPLKQLAEETGVAVLLVRHLNKDGSLRAMYRGGGSIAFTAAARSVLVTERHPVEEGVLVLARVKTNIAAPIRPITFRLEADPKHDAPRVVWGEAVDLDVDVLLRGADGRLEAPARKAAEQDLFGLLKDGPQNVKAVREAMDAAGHSWRTVKNAKAKLKVKVAAIHDGAGKIKGWLWRLPVYTDGNVVHFDFR